MTKFTPFLGGPNGPKIFSRRTKTDFMDWGLLISFLTIRIVQMFEIKYLIKGFCGWRLDFPKYFHVLD